MNKELHTPLWEPTPSSTSDSHMARFIKALEQPTVQTYSELYDWSLKNRDEFWSAVWDYCKVLGEKDSLHETPHVFSPAPIFRNAQWFPHGALNFAENLLWKNDDSEAIVFYGEQQGVQRWSFRTLREHTLRIRTFFQQHGVSASSTVAAVTANTPETIACMLAATSLGATWCSVAPEFGPTGILERFQQVSPDILVASERYYYKGKEISLTEKTRHTLQALPSIRAVLTLPYLDAQGDSDAHTETVRYETVQTLPLDNSPFERFSFNHPLYYLFTSGTTGKPKGIIHGAGGTLLEHKKELMLHTDLGEGDTIFYQTTCAWMMWNWLVSSLSVGARLILYDGFPLEKNGSLLLEIAARERISIFGTNPGYLREVANEAVLTQRTYDLTHLRAVLSTGAPLLPTQFEWFYKTFPKEVRLSSISGGTDIVGCFALGNPLLPVYAGELQCRSLGYRVEAMNDAGESVTGERGELVCTEPFMSMPVGFVGDDDGARYEGAYFQTFPNIWHHGDAITITEHGSVIVHERSDDVLNAGGVRIGPAEIYRQALSLPEVQEACAVTMSFEAEDRIVLFLIIAPGSTWDEEQENTLRMRLRTEESPRHIPWKIIIAEDFPRTLSGKTSASAIRTILQGKKAPNEHALKNPEVLRFYEAVCEDLKCGV